MRGGESPGSGAPHRGRADWRDIGGDLRRLREELAVAPDVERPTIRILVAIAGQISGRPIIFRVINLLDWPTWQSYRFTFVGVDPADEEAFYRWLSGRH